MSIYPTQTRSVDPYASYNSNIVNMLTRIVSNSDDVILPFAPIEVSQLTSTSVRCSAGKCVKDDVYIELSQHDVDLTDGDNYVEVGGGALDSTGYYYIVLQYTYVKSRPAPVASIQIIKPSQRGSLFGAAHLLLKVVDIGAGGTISSLLDYDPENPANRRKVGAPKAVSIQNVSSNYTIPSDAGIVVGTGNITLTLPPATNKIELGIFKADSGTTLTILPDGADTISGEASLSWTVQYSCGLFISDGVSNWYVIRGAENIEGDINALQSQINSLQSQMDSIENLDSSSNIVIALTDTREDLEDLTNRTEISKNILRTNQSFVDMYYDDFISTSKTNASYISKVDIDNYQMTPGSGGEWRALTWTATSTVTVCKLVWRSGGSFNHNIQISANGGSNWTTISTAGSESNMDKEVTITNSGTSIILRVSGGTQGYLKDYTLLVK